MIVSAPGQTVHAADTFGGFDFTPLIKGITDPEVQRSPFGLDLVRLLLASFVSSQGRQYAQLCDLYVLVALIQERYREGRLRIDWGLIDDTPRIAQVFDRMPLPGGHTRSPERIPGQIGGVYRFWWATFCDVFAHRFDGVDLPASAELDDRMRDCGVPLYATSSSRWEELSAIHEAFAAYRNDPTVEGATPAELARRCLPPHLAAELHWQTEPRPRHRTGRTAAVPDRHGLMLRTLIADAAATPAERRSPYDDCMLLIADALDDLLGTPQSDPSLVELHRHVVDAYNAHHPHGPITRVHQ